MTPFSSLLLRPVFPDITMLLNNVHSFGNEIVPDQLCERDRTVLSAGAAESDHQTALSLLNIQGDKKIQEIFQLFHQRLGLFKGHHIVLHAFFTTGVVAQFRDIVGVRQTAHVKHQVRLCGNAVLEPERCHLNGHGV